uniref:Importin N-terminal domain-containing protein n=1 Tax=Ganoderma boninense TaxID=34458 RepID=A0A5K1K349_9APHY|nr:Importin N-terminal domain-containing protein [Ganoderma boninense]
MPSEDKTYTGSLPIPISEGRRRSGSVSESDSGSSDSASNSPPSPFPSPASSTLPRIAPFSPSTSPILSYFLSNQSTSPKSPPSTFPFRRGTVGATFYEDEDVFETDKPIHSHGRRASAAAWSGHDRYPPVVSAPGDQQERAAGLLRRLSLSANMTKPPVPTIPKQPTSKGPPQAPRSKTPPNLKSNSAAGAPPAVMRKARRANTLAPGTPRPPRAPSPMGERILKGHFDGFS